MSLAQGSDAVLNDKLSYQAYNRLKNHFAKTTNPGDLQEGMIWFDKTNQKMILQKLGGPVDLVPAVSVFPEGMIIPWSGGYFTNGANAGYTRVLGASNDAAGINALLNGKGWYVCDGAALNIPGSTIYNGPGRYLPNLTDDRFLMGGNTVGGIGGSSSSAHTHVVGSLVNAAEASHTHAAGAVTVNAEASHTHAAGAVTVNAEASHTHGAGAVTVNAEASHTHGATGLSNAVEASHVHAGGTLAVEAEAAHTHGPGSFSTNNEGAHVHTVNPPDTSSGGPSNTSNYQGGSGTTGPTYNHTHDTNIAAFDSGSAGVHYHNIYTGTSGAGSSHGHALSGSTAAGSSHNHAISGSTAAGSSHAHTASGAATGAGSSHAHTASGAATGAGSSHNHTISGNTGAASATENRPSFLAVMFLQYVLAA